MTTTKTCTKCRETYPATLEYFYHHPQGKGSLRPNCKECTRKNQMDYLNSMTPKARAEMKDAERRRNIHTYRQASRKRVAKEKGVYHENWTEQQLFDTYGTDCYICNKAIDFDAPKRGPGSDFSSWPDHIIPTSRGGENTIRNVRPCHRKCNQSKYTMTYDEFINSDRYGS